MKELQKIGVLIIAILFLQGCYVSKSLDRDVNVLLNENFPITITNTGNSTFSSSYTEADYRAAFIEGMKSEFASSHIIVVQSDHEFSISISDLTINESSKTETVSDPESDDNGKEFELSSLNLQSKGAVVRISDNNSRDWWADKSKDEKVTNSRSGGQVITGENKDRTTYREKEFSADQALDLAQKCGRRSAARIVNDIVKALK